MRKFWGLFVASVAVLVWVQVAFSQPITLRVGVYENPPKILVKDDQISGIFGELLMQIASREGWRIEAVPCNWNQCLSLLQSGDIDLMPDVALSTKRDETFRFHEIPFLHSWSQLYGKSTLKVTTLLDLDNVRIAVLDNSIQESYLADITKNFGLNVTLIPVDSFDAGFQAVVDGRAEAVAANHLYGDIKARDLGLEPTPVMFQPARLFVVATRADLQPVLDKIDEYLSDWQQDPQSPLYETLKKWRANPSAPEPFPWSLVIGLASALLLVIGVSLLLRRRIHERTLELAHSELKLNTILDSVEAYIFIKDRELRYQYANKKVCDYLGTTPQQIIGKTDAAFFDEKTCQHLRENDRRVIEQGLRVSEEEDNATQSGDVRHFLSVKIPLKDTHDQVYALCGISTDITEHIHIKESLNKLEYYDNITGLANRKLLLQNLEHAVTSAARTGYEGALVAIDLTHFTVINETFGHAAGDKLLQEVAQRIRARVDETDTVARLGSDDFLVILEDVSQDADQAVMEVRNWAREILDVLAQPFDLGDIKHTTSASIGITMFSDSQGDAAGLLKNADLAISEAKSQGGGSIRFFNPAMQEAISRRMLIESALRKAVQHQELDVYLQPQVNSRNEVIAGELLLRWTDPDLGTIAPAEFIPIAEASGLIIPIGTWVIEQACRTLRDWQQIDALKSIPLAVNISPRQFRHGGFVAQVEHCLHEAGLPRGLLELEITESMLIDNIEVTVKRMCKLGDLGVRFSLDDFGTGYASLAYLKKLPLQQLKIDQSFVRDMLADANDEIIIKTILGLGENLNFSVIAEGVETEKQLEHLKALGCKKFQGYLFGKPAPIPQWQQRLIENINLVSEN
ncbi:EAL domain-containing protein [Pseudidiomarina andamanensis]|uniref:EAL domain-containing protein n=1 Tax=Pseudidiomarina andamanensis TaxID=1940690 RepID=A0AA92IM89_9GAMM|nr:EAL domain-containing protein [Pseudidiomarina andamanensis]MDS0218841.1 EAL domain-containing protein [Pseudidiomarina andamanensis]QGT96208.1 EAL domain-containing protein [Pseudidiomarina andamanensis]